jgi:putative ABC transport system substrate-binding protein
VQAADPVNLGLVTNLSRPEGNVTGFVLIEPSICGKWLQLLHDVAPKTTEVLVLQNSNNPSSEAFVRSIEAAAPPLGMIVNVTSVSDGAQIERAIAAIAGRPNVGLLVLPGPALSNERERIISLALRHHLPAIYPFKFYAIDGGLMFYGADNIDQWRQAASYVDRILRGSQPRDLPIQLPTKFDLVINLRTAKAIGLTIPRDMLLIADEMIE